MPCQMQRVNAQLLDLVRNVVGGRRRAAGRRRRWRRFFPGRSTCDEDRPATAAPWDTPGGAIWVHVQSGTLRLGGHNVVAAGQPARAMAEGSKGD